MCMCVCVCPAFFTGEFLSPCVDLAAAFIVFVATPHPTASPVIFFLILRLEEGGPQGLSLRPPLFFSFFFNTLPSLSLPLPSFLGKFFSMHWLSMYRQRKLFVRLMLFIFVPH